MSVRSSRALFAPVDLRPYFNTGGVPSPGRWHDAMAAALAELPSGERRFWGIPFELGPSEGDGGGHGGGRAQQARCWILLGASVGGEQAVTIPLAGAAASIPETAAPTYLVFVHVCDAPAAVGGDTLEAEPRLREPLDTSG